MILTDYDRELINGIVQRIDFLRAEQELTMYQLALRANMSENSLKFIYKKQSYFGWFDFSDNHYVFPPTLTAAPLMKCPATLPLLSRVT